MKKLDISTICKRIAVQAPYLAFDTLELDNNFTLHGTFNAEQPLDLEHGPITAAEVGRHLAILGACVAATAADSEMLYYLATEAEYVRIDNPSSDVTNQTFRAAAKISNKSKRSLTVNAFISDETVRFATLNVRYKVLTQSLFERLFGQFRMASTAPLTNSPYATLLPLSFNPPGTDSADTQPLSLSAALCSGHFPKYPAWPVALIMHSLGRVIGHLLWHLYGVKNYTITHAHILAEVLAAAGWALTFHAHLNMAETEPPDYAFICEARHGDKVVARLEAHCQVAKR